MKNLLLVILLAFVATASYATKVPAAVKKAFEAKFPKATEVKWGKENATEYEAEFKLNGGKVSANFSADGTWLETETEIPVAQIPAKVTDAIKKLYPEWSLTGGDRIESSKKGTFYEADLKKGMKKKEVSFKEDGTPMK